MTDAPRFGKTKYATIRRDFNNLRDAINRHDVLATEAAWEKCERWLEAIPTSDTIADLQAENAKLREALKTLESANDQVCLGRSQATYDQIIADNQGDDLAALDDARRHARAALSGQDAEGDT